MSEIKPIVVIHGGAGAVPDERCALYVEGVKAAARCGYKVLEDGGSALDAAEAGVISMEECPTFNAGVGSALTYDEQVEMDAIIIDGRTIQAGAVGAIRNIRHPIEIARLVMEKTPHVLLVEAAHNVVTTHFKELAAIEDDGMTAEDYLREAHPYVTYVGAPLFILLACLLLAFIGRHCYMTRLASSVNKLRRLTRLPDAADDRPPSVELETANPQEE